MASTDIVDIGGLDIRSAPVFARDCHFPIVDWVQHCPADQVLANMMVMVGAWEDGTVAPAITDYQTTVTPVTPADDCEVPTLNTTIETCELIAPDMAEIAIGTANLNWKELRTQFCKQRNLLPGQLCVFNTDGSLATGEPYTIDFIRFALADLVRYMGVQLSIAALSGDDANLNEFDGLYNQLENGWMQSAGSPCDDRYNLAQVIDWQALTGSAAPAPPDAETIAGQTVNWWGTVYDVPEGLNLAQLLEDMWIDSVNINWADAKGGVDSWEMHMPWGLAKCMLNTAACMKACTTCGSTGVSTEIQDEILRERIRRLRNLNVMELFPSGTQIPLLQSQRVEDNTMWLGPSSIGGRPSYVLFLDSIARYLDLWQTDGGFGTNGLEMDALAPMTTDVLMNNFESETLFWYLKQKSIKCLEAQMIMCAGLLVCNRHLWLKIENVDCCNAIEPCDDHITVA